MTKQLLITIMALMFCIGNLEVANATSEHSGHGAKTSHESGDSSAMGNSFTHEAVIEGIRAEFQVMSLEAMKMKDPEGNTHHVMAKFFDQNTKEQIKNAVGKIKIIRPSGKEQIATLKDYSGILAANFAVEEHGKYGVICLVKIGEKKHIIKFWYQPPM